MSYRENICTIYLANNREQGVVFELSEFGWAEYKRTHTQEAVEHAKGCNICRARFVADSCRVDRPKKGQSKHHPAQH
jgi:hypothetical protein